MALALQNLQLTAPFEKQPTEKLEALSQLPEKFWEAIMSTQLIIHPKTPFPYKYMRVTPCTTPEPPLRVGTEPHGPEIIPLDNKPTGLNFITKEEEETATGPPPRRKLYYNPKCTTSIKLIKKSISSKLNISFKIKIKY